MLSDSAIGTVWGQGYSMSEPITFELENYIQALLKKHSCDCKIYDCNMLIFPIICSFPIIIT